MLQNHGNIKEPTKLKPQDKILIQEILHTFHNSMKEQNEISMKSTT